MERTDPDKIPQLGRAVLPVPIGPSAPDRRLKLASRSIGRHQNGRLTTCPGVTRAVFLRDMTIVDPYHPLRMMLVPSWHNGLLVVASLSAFLGPSEMTLTSDIRLNMRAKYQAFFSSLQLAIMDRSYRPDKLLNIVPSC